MGSGSEKLPIYANVSPAIPHSKGLCTRIVFKHSFELLSLVWPGYLKIRKY